MNAQDECEKESEVKMKKYELQPPEGGWGYFIAIAMIIILITATTIMGVFGLLYNDFLQEIGMGSTSVTLLTGICALCYAISGFVTGPLLKIMSKRKLALLAAIVFDLGVLGNVFANSVYVFFICQGVMQGLGIGMLYNVTCTMLNDYFVKRRMFITSVAQTIIAVIAMCAPMIIEWSLKEYGYRGTLLLLSGVIFHNLVAVALLQPVEWHMRKVEIPNEKDNETPLLLQMDKKESEYSHEVPVVKLTDVEGNKIKPLKAIDLPLEPEKDNRVMKVIKLFVDIQLSKKLLKSCALMGPALGLFVDTTFMLILPQALYADGWKQEETALALSLFGFGDLAARIFFVFTSRWISKLGSQETYLIGIVISLLSKLGMLWSKSKTGILVYITIMGLARCSIIILIPLVVADAVKPEQFTSAIGLNILISGLINLILGPVIGAVRDLTHSYSTAFYILSSLFGVVILFWSIELCYKRSKHKRQARRAYLKQTKYNKQTK